MYKLISHRGIKKENIIENSYESIKKALESDEFVGVEFDVRITKDNEFIIYHDALYNNKLIKNTLYKELPKYVPRLIDILNINSDKLFVVEIKNINENYNLLINILDKYKDKKLYVMSFSNKVINKLDIENRFYKLGILNYVLNTNTNIKKLDFVCILNSLLNDNIVDNLKDLEIFSYGLLEKKKYDNIFYIVD